MKDQDLYDASEKAWDNAREIEAIDLMIGAINAHREGPASDYLRNGFIYLRAAVRANQAGMPRLAFTLAGAGLAFAEKPDTRAKLHDEKAKALDTIKAWDARLEWEAR